MPIYEITSPDGRLLEIEGDKAPSESDLNEIFKTIPAETNKSSVNQTALHSVKSTDDEPEPGETIAERFNKLRQDAAQYVVNAPQKEKGMSWIEYAKLRRKYDEDWGLQTPELNPLKAIWKTSVLGMVNEKLYRGQKEKRASKYVDNSEVITKIPEQAIKDWQEKGEIKAGEAFMRSDWTKAVPFIGSVSGLNETFDIKGIIDKKNRGEELSKKEIERLNGYIMDVAEQNLRGISFGGKLIQGALELPSFALEFMATGGLASIGKTAMQKTLTKGLQNAAQKEIGKRLTRGLIEGGAGAVTRTTIGMPQRVAENYGMRRLHDSLGITDKGQVILETSDEAPARTFLKAWGDTVIENWSEEMGGGLAEAAGLSFKGAKKFLSPLEDKLFSRNTRAAFIKAMRKIRPNATVKDIMTRAGFNGILEEMGEERAGDVLRVIFGIDDRQDVSTFEKLCEAINPGAEELLLELGLFSIPGSMSFAASQVANHLRKQNVSEEDIDDYMKLSSELEKEQFLADIAENRDLTATIDFDNKVKTLKNRYFTQNLNAGIEKEEALATADIQANAIASLAKNIGMDINELNQEFNINLQSMTAESGGALLHAEADARSPHSGAGPSQRPYSKTDEQAKAQQESDTIVLQGGVSIDVGQQNQSLYQSAMYKSPKKSFEDFYNQVFEKENRNKGDNTGFKKSYFDYTSGNVSVRVPHDTVIPDGNKHSLTVSEWVDVLSHLSNPVDAVESNKARFDGKPVLLKLVGEDNSTYGAVVEFFDNKQPILATAFKDTEKNIDNWLNKNRSAQAKNTSSVTTKGMLLSQDPNAIINDVKANLNPANNQGTFDADNPNIYYQSAAMRKSRFDNFADFYNDVLSKPKNTNNKEQFNALTKDGLNIRIPHDTVIHDDKRHELSSDEWLDLLNNIDDVSVAVLSKKKSSYDGKSVLLKINTKNNIYGVVLETFAKNNPLISTAFIDTEKNIDNWIKNEAIPSGTKTSFLGIRLNNIISDIQPEFKPKTINSKIYYQSSVNLENFLSKNNSKQIKIKDILPYIQNFDKIKEFFDDIEDVNIDFVELNQSTKKHLNGYYDSKLNTIFLNKDSFAANNIPVARIKAFLHELQHAHQKKRYDFYKNKLKNNKNVSEKQVKEYNKYILDYDNTSKANKEYRKFWNKHKKELFELYQMKKNLEYDNFIQELQKPENKKLFDIATNNNKYYNEYRNSVLEQDAENTAIDLIYKLGLGEQYENQKRKADEKNFGRSYKSGSSIYDRRFEYGSGRSVQDGRRFRTNDEGTSFDIGSEIYYQSENDYSPIDNAKGFTYQRFNFDGTTKDNLIVLLKNKSDKSTLLHEFAHVYLTTLNNLARKNDRAKELLITVNKWLNYNGVEYTTKQHEKFANGFVAYVKAGKAPTYGLKRAFENFKRWLNDLYSNLMLSEEIELDKETRSIFDELLGDNSITAKDEKIADIINKAKQNALLRLSYEYAEKRKIEPLHLTDKQRRFRDAAYEIIYTAAHNIKDENGNPLVKDIRELRMLFGNSSVYGIKNKGIKHRREKIELAILEVDDAFSGGDGFQRNWAEFFNDTGVSYDNMETRADSELVAQALDVINEKRYLYDTDNLNDNREFNEEDVKKTEYELNYIIEEYKNSENRDLAVAAFFEWVDGLHPYIEEDIITKWENLTNEIDRYENLGEFQKAKEDLKMYAATLKGYGDYSSQFAEYARKILKRLDFITELDKEKIFGKLKEFNSFREIERNLDEIMDYAETLNDVSLRRNLADTIINEIKRTTPIIQNGTKKTRYDYQTNKLFEKLRYLNSLKQEEIKDIYDAYVNEEMERRASQFEETGTITGKTEDYFNDIENSFIQFKANGIYYNSTEALQTLLDKIQNAKFTGKVARDEMDFEIRMNQKNWVDNCAKALESHKGKVGKGEELYAMEANFDSLLSMIFDDNIKNKFSLDDLYAQVDGRVGKDREDVLNKIAEIFGFKGVMKGAMLNNKFIEMANDKHTIKQRYANKQSTDNMGVWQWEDITLSRMEILYYYIQAKNPTSYKMLTDMGDKTTPAKGQFDKFEFDNLINILTDQEKLVGDILQLSAEKYYNDLNKYHIKKHHIDMGKVTCYFPRKSELSEVNELDLFNQYTEKSTNPKFVKMRSAGPSIRISPANPVNVLFNHIQKANTIIIMGDQLDLMNKVFRDNDLKQKIKSVYGDKVYTEFMQHVTENLYSGQAKTLSNAEGIISKVMSNVIASPMLIKPQIGIKQVIGLINYGVGDEYVGTIEWLKAFNKVIKNPKSAIEFMMQDEYLKDRLTRANLNEAMKNQVDNKMFSRLGMLTDYFSLNMRLGDLLNLTLGGRAYVQVLLDKGFSKGQAFELFRKKTISDQQSSISSTLSNMQRNSKNNPFARLLFAYQNTPHQYFRICANAIIKAKQGKITKTQAAKTVFIYWWFLPFIFNMASSLSPITLLTTGDPEELYNDMLIACLGSISCIPFFGEMARALFSGITGQEYFGNKDWFTRANEAIVKPVQKIRKGDLSFGDILKSSEILAMGFGIPLEEIITQLESIKDYAEGDFAEGFLKNLGFSRYRAKKLTGQED